MAFLLFSIYLAGGVMVGGGHVGDTWYQKQDRAVGRKDLEAGQGVMA